MAERYEVTIPGEVDEDGNVALAADLVGDAAGVSDPGLPRRH